MLKNYFISAFRSFRNQKIFSLINILGLSCGTACFVLIALFVNDELTYDRHYKSSERIYLGELNYKTGFSSGINSYFTSVAEERFPEIIKVAHLSYSSTVVIEDNGSLTYEGKHYTADPDILEVLELPLLYGDKSNALTSSGGVVISKEIMDKYFSGENPVGKSITFKQRGATKLITGVLADQPKNSSYHFNFLEPDNSTPSENKWGPIGGTKFFLLNDNIEISSFKSRLAELAVELEYPGHQNFEFSIKKLTDLHLYGGDREAGISKNLSNVYVFSIIGIMLLLIAVINYVNATTARMLTRNKEIGVRKTFGASNGQIKKQYLMESMILSALAVILAAGIVEVLLPGVNEISGKEIRINYFDAASVLPLYAILIPFIGLLAGFYPSIFSSRFQALDILKRGTSAKKSYLRYVLVGFQFVITLGLLFSTQIISKQIEAMQNSKLNADIDNIVVPNFPFGKDYQTVANELSTIPGVESVFSTPFPSVSGSRLALAFNQGDNPDTVRISPVLVSDDAPDILNLSFIYGQGFDENTDVNQREVLINEATAKLLPWENPVGETVRLMNDEYSFENFIIKGVYRNTNFNAKANPYPVYMRTSNKLWSINLKLAEANIPQTLSALGDKWLEIAPNAPVRYQFLEDTVASYYDQERRFGELFGYFSWIAIALASIGVFGLSSFTVTRMYKEIGIRKVLGASSIGVSNLIFKRYLAVIGVSAVIAIPLVLYYMNQWLDSFALQVSIQPDVFLIGVFATVALTILTVGFQTWKAANSNPTLILKEN